MNIRENRDDLERKNKQISTATTDDRGWTGRLDLL
jgi:hypothetical protein